jgi:predicted transcriptional regulator
VFPRSTPSAYSLERASGLSERVCYILFMAEPATKDRILKAVEELPDDVTLDEAIEKLCFLAKVERGLKQANEGKTVSHDQAKERLLG